jgi:hypothetical protein
MMDEITPTPAMTWGAWLDYYLEDWKIPQADVKEVTLNHNPDCPGRRVTSPCICQPEFGVRLKRSAPIPVAMLAERSGDHE